MALTTVLALALTGAGAALVVLGADDERPTGGPREASAADLRALAAETDRPFYWAGTGPGNRFELTQTRSGKVFVRYLPAGVAVADGRAAFLTIATYPYARAYAVTNKSSHRAGMTSALTSTGGLAAWSEKRPSSVYLASPGSDLLVEVFSPDPAEARRLVLEGQVLPVEPGSGSDRAAARLARPSELRP